MTEHVELLSSADDREDALLEAKETARAAGRRVRTLVSIKGEPGAWTVRLALDVPEPKGDPA